MGNCQPCNEANEPNIDTKIYDFRFDEQWKDENSLKKSASLQKFEERFFKEDFKEENSLSKRSTFESKFKSLTHDLYHDEYSHLKGSVFKLDPEQDRCYRFISESHEPQEMEEEIVVKLIKLKKVEKMNSPTKIVKNILETLEPLERSLDINNGFNPIFGPYYYEDGSTYRGQYLNGRKMGYGVEISKNGDYFEGKFDRNKKIGKGRYITADGVLTEGYFDGLILQGDGFEEDHIRGVKTIGEFCDGVIQGVCKRRYKDGSVYKGALRDGKRFGRGLVTFKDGGYYEGFFQNDKYQGSGKFD